MIELKKCPFCGGEAEVADILVYYKDGKAIRCKKCFARSMFVLIDSPKVNLFNNKVDESTRYTPEQAAELAAEKWNLREEPAETLHNRWIPVTERLPQGNLEMCKNVILLMDDGIVTAGWLNANTSDGGKVFYLDAVRDYIVKAPISRCTHWMPLPEPPKGE